MALSDEEVTELKDRIDAALSKGNLSAWPTKFLKDMRARIDQHGVHTRLSTKQWNKLEELTGTLRVPNPTVSPPRIEGHQKVRGLQRRWSFETVHLAFAVAVLVALSALAYPLFFEGSVFVANNWAPFTVTDGDTIRFLGRSRGTRLVGFNTPETFQPLCERERELGMRATERLKELVATSDIEVSEVPCACEPGTEGTDACNFGRTCAVMTANGRNVGDILVSEGLAARFLCGSFSCPRLPRPWCG